VTKVAVSAASTGVAAVLPELLAQQEEAGLSLSQVGDQAYGGGALREALAEREPCRRGLCTPGRWARLPIERDVWLRKAKTAQAPAVYAGPVRPLPSINVDKVKDLHSGTLSISRVSTL
jgi:hypothetical protein